MGPTERLKAVTQYKLRKTPSKVFQWLSFACVMVQHRGQPYNLSAFMLPLQHGIDHVDSAAAPPSVHTFFLPSFYTVLIA